MPCQFYFWVCSEKNERNEQSERHFKNKWKLSKLISCQVCIDIPVVISPHRIRWHFPQLISPFPAITRKCDCTHFHPMALSRPIDSTRSWGNVAQRLMQVGCNILYSMLRLITSSNHIASIMDIMPVSTSRASLATHHHITTQRMTLATLWDYTKHDAARMAVARRPKESLFL